VAYATEQDYAAWTGLPVAPPGTQLRLQRASAFLDGVLIGAVYPVDVAGVPTDAAHAAALRDATCAQAEYWAGTGDSDGTGASSVWDSVAIGSVRLSRIGRRMSPQGDLRPSGGGDNGGRVLAPLATDLLSNAGLLPTRPLVTG